MNEAERKIELAQQVLQQRAEIIRIYKEMEKNGQ